MQVASLAIFHSQADAQIIASERVELDDIRMLIKLTKFLHDPAFVPRHLDLTRILLAGLPLCLLKNVVIVIQFYQLYSAQAIRVDLSNHDFIFFSL